MNKIKNILLYIFFTFLIHDTHPSEEAVIISEFMASNHNTIEDGYGESSDWIELHNYGSTLIDLTGWFLTDSASIPDKYSFPSGTVIHPNEFLIIFASGKKPKTNKDPKRNLHAGFRLSKNGEYLAIIKPDKKTIVHDYSPNYPLQFNDVSYGVSMRIKSHPSPTAQDIGYFKSPTPGAVNNHEISHSGPIIKKVEHEPKILNDSESLIITAEIDKASLTVDRVNLYYRIMHEPEQVTIMLDNGRKPDNKSNDGIYSALIDKSNFKPGHMVRYYVEVNKNISNIAPTRSPPYPKSENAPKHYGTIVRPVDIDGCNLPILHWFLEDEKSVDRVVSSHQRHGVQASVYFDGRFYDNIFSRVRGASGPSFSKKSYKLDFNPGYKFKFLPGQPAVEEINLNSNYQDKAKVREPLAYETYRKSGVISPDSYQVRVHRNGEFFSIANLTEQVDKTFLNRRSLDPEGALYKMYNSGTTSTSGVSKQTRKYESNVDLRQLVTGLKLKGAKGENYVFDNLNVPQIINYWAAGTIIQDFDRTSKNWYLYRDSNNTGQWMMIPWDKDLTFGLMSLQTDNVRGNHDSPTSGTSKVGHPFFGIYENCCSGANSDSGNKVMKALFETRRGREMFLRRLRSLMDEILQAPGTRKQNLFYEDRLDERYEAMRVSAELDLEKWNWGFGSKQTLKQAINILSRKYLMERRIHLFRTHSVNNNKTRKNALIPDSQNRNVVLMLEVDDNMIGSEKNEKEYIKINNLNSFAVDVSNFQLDGLISYKFKPGTVIPSKDTIYLTKNYNSFRSREKSPRGGEGLFIQGDYKGRLSYSRGGVITMADDKGKKLTDFKCSPKLSSQQKYLRITELHYNPQMRTGDNGLIKLEDECEFIELKNIGDINLSLNGVKFNDGIKFTFPPIILKPGASTIITSNLKAFKACYGSELNIAGEYIGNLNNGGERIKLIDTEGNIILNFRYNDNWYSATDGNGYSMVVRSEMSHWSNWGNATNWGVSNQLGGSPGTDNTIFNVQYEGWLLSFYNEDEIKNPENYAADADSDKDGIPTVIEYALGLNPSEPDSSVAITSAEIIEQKDDAFLSCKMSVLSNRIDLNYRGQVSYDLIKWIEAPINLRNLHDGHTEISIYDAHSIHQTNRKYYRIQIIKTKF